MPTPIPSGPSDLRATALELIRKKVLLAPEVLARYRELRLLHRRAADPRSSRPAPSRPIGSPPAVDTKRLASQLVEPWADTLGLSRLRTPQTDPWLDALDDAARRTREHFRAPVDPEDPRHARLLRREFLQSLAADRNRPVRVALDEAPFEQTDRVCRSLAEALAPTVPDAGRDPATWEPRLTDADRQVPDLVLGLAITFLHAQDQGAEDARAVPGTRPRERDGGAGA